MTQSAYRSGGGKTTVRWQRLPTNCSPALFLQLLDSSGFRSEYDFFYSPFDPSSSALIGYAIINFVSADAASRFKQTFHGFYEWAGTHSAHRAGSVVDWNKLQGLGKLVETYRNGAAMHPDMEDDFRPQVFRNGARIPFPSPTRKVPSPPNGPASRKRQSQAEQIKQRDTPRLTRPCSPSRQLEDVRGFGRDQFAWAKPWKKASLTTQVHSVADSLMTELVYLN